MKQILSLFLFFSVSYAYATVDYLKVNQITKELFWAESDTNEGGFLGWEVIPERSHHKDLRNYLNLGYTYTKFPYKLDILAGLIVILPLLILFIRRRQKRLNPR